jgi:hypothetical protein
MGVAVAKVHLSVPFPFLRLCLAHCISHTKNRPLVYRESLTAAVSARGSKA